MKEMYIFWNFLHTTLFSLKVKQKETIRSLWMLNTLFLGYLREFIKNAFSEIDWKESKILRKIANSGYWS